MKNKIIVSILFIVILSCTVLSAQDFNMGSDATQGQYGWFNSNVTTIDLNTGAAAPFDGTMIQWRMMNAFMGGTAAMKVFRDSSDMYVLVAEDSRTIGPGSGLNVFTVNILVEEGDLLGIYVSDYDLVMCSTGGSMVMHSGNTGTSQQSTWTPEGFTLACDALVQSSAIEEREDEDSPVVEQFHGWPNPSGPGFQIRYQIAVSGDATLGIYNIAGCLIRQFSIPSSQFPIGSVIWDGKDDFGSDVPGGIYFYQLQSGNYRETKRMVLLK